MVLHDACLFIVIMTKMNAQMLSAFALAALFQPLHASEAFVRFRPKPFSQEAKPFLPFVAAMSISLMAPTTAMFASTHPMAILCSQPAFKARKQQMSG